MMQPGHLREYMNEGQNPLVLLGTCVVIVFLSILGVFAALGRTLDGTLDGLMMIAVCLMMAVIFVLLLFVLAQDQGWIGKHKPKDGGAPPAGAGK
jgi:hypothetical protein